MKATTAMKVGNCGAKTRSGGQCQKSAGWGTGHVGTGRCKLHGGSTPSQELHEAVKLARSQMAVMGQPLDIEPHEAIMQCIEIAAGEVHYASDQIAELDEGEVVGAVQTSRPLKEEKGAEDPHTYVTEYGAPAAHIWVKLRHEAMDRLVNYSKIAIAAGIAERQVRIAEQQGEMLAEFARNLMRDMGIDPGSQKARELMRRNFTLIAGGRVA